MREPFTLEQLHLFNFPYFLYFSPAPPLLFLSTFYSDWSSPLKKRSSKFQWEKPHPRRPHLWLAGEWVPSSSWRWILLQIFLSCLSPPIALVQPSPIRGRAGLADVLCPMCARRAHCRTTMHGAHAGRRTNRFRGGHTHRWRERRWWSRCQSSPSKLLPLRDVGGRAVLVEEDGGQHGDAAAVSWEMALRRPHLVGCTAGLLLLLLAGVGAQKKLLEKVLKKTTTLKPRLLQTSDGKHSDVAF